MRFGVWVLDRDWDSGDDEDEDKDEDDDDVVCCWCRIMLILMCSCAREQWGGWGDRHVVQGGKGVCRSRRFNNKSRQGDHICLLREREKKGEKSFM